MNVRRVLTLAAILALSVFLALALRDVVAVVVILPLLYLWWLVKIFYAAVPQVITWGILAALIFYSATLSLLPRRKPRPGPEVKAQPARGQIETLAELIEKSGRGNYYKWLVAHRLGKDAREILAQRDGQPISNRFGILGGRGWNPPREVADYLNSGLNSSFAEYPRRKWFWQKQPPTPLDIKARQALEYLEDEMETENGRR